MSFSVSGRAAVVAFLAGPLIPDQEARLIQANDFVQSEIRWDNATGTGKQHTGFFHLREAKQGPVPLLTLRLENNIEGMDVKWSEMAKGALHTLKHKAIIITIKWAHMAIVVSITAV